MANGRLTYASPPASVITIDSTDAKMGRSMKNREITDVLPKVWPPVPAQPNNRIF